MSVEAPNRTKPRFVDFSRGFVPPELLLPENGNLKGDYFQRMVARELESLYYIDAVYYTTYQGRYDLAGIDLIVTTNEFFLLGRIEDIGVQIKSSRKTKKHRHEPSAIMLFGIDTPETREVNFIAQAIELYSPVVSS